jgi:predicted ribosomally synthesized peptide with nif11-like leader
MSKAHAKKFIDQLHKDKVLHKKVNEASQHIVSLAKGHGYKVTSEEISDALKAHWSQAKEEDDDHPCIIFSQAPSF